jgi:hypothetical protein
MIPTSNQQKANAYFDEDPGERKPKYQVVIFHVAIFCDRSPTTPKPIVSRTKNGD